MKLAWIALTLTLVCMGLCVTTVQAQSPVVWAGFDDAELLARIRGQTRDLPIQLISAPDEHVTQPTAAQLHAIAREHHAEFVVSVDQEPGAPRVVYVFDAGSSELRVRTAPAPDRKHRFGRSAAAETVALIVRGELSDALAVREERQAADNRGSSVPATASATESASTSGAGPRKSQEMPAAPKPERTPSQPAQQEKPRSPRPQAEPREEEEAQPSREETSETEEPDAYEPASPSSGKAWLDASQLSLELAGRASTVVDKRVFLGGALTLRWSLEHFSLGITGSTTLADRTDRQALTLTLHEHTLGLEALAHLRLSAAFSAGLGAAGRFSFYRRSASSRDPSWKPQPSETNSTLALGPTIELRWQLQQHLGVGIRLGLDVLLRPVSFRYRLDTNTSVPVELLRQNRAEPWLSLGLFGSL